MSVTMRMLAVTSTREEMKVAWDQVQKTTREVWNEEHPIHQRKVQHLIAKSRDCARHGRCSELDKMVLNRIKAWSTVTDAKSASSSTYPTPSTTAGMTNPPRLAHPRMTEEQDLAQLDREEEQLMILSMEHVKNRFKAAKIEGKEVEEEKDEVVVFGDVDINDDEWSLLNLGPGFMVTSDLDEEDMQVEAVVALTKIRWGRRSRGTENMTDADINKEERDTGLDKLEEEESLAAAIETEARDVLDSEEVGVCMGRTRATDMRNNREVCMSGPDPPSVEAGHNT